MSCPNLYTRALYLPFIVVYPIYISYMVRAGRSPFYSRREAGFRRARVSSRPIDHNCRLPRTVRILPATRSFGGRQTGRLWPPLGQIHLESPPPKNIEKCSDIQHPPSSYPRTGLSPVRGRHLRRGTRAAAGSCRTDDRSIESSGLGAGWQQTWN